MPKNDDNIIIEGKTQDLLNEYKDGGLKNYQNQLKWFILVNKCVEIKLNSLKN